MARPRKVLDTEQIEKLAAINCSFSEIAAVTGVNVSTITRRFAHVIEKGREIGKSSLKRKMWEIAMKGNVGMCIWLSKQMLGYTDKNEKAIENLIKTDAVYVAEWGNTHEPTDKADS